MSAACTSSVGRAVRTMSHIHKTATSLWKQDMTVDHFLRTQVFSKENFPKVLTFGISFSCVEFMGVFCWKYFQNTQAKKNLTTTAAATVTRKPTAATTASRGAMAMARHASVGQNKLRNNLNYNYW
mmetsp:Transcript_489/g.911  ORF Transcript_489/g.911 Transcript_489/m.911 type:complete len:126 (+) Transcript_489:1-378(+)